MKALAALFVILVGIGSISIVIANRKLPVYKLDTADTEVGKIKEYAIVRLQGNVFCTGTVVSPNYINTAAHCLAEESRATGAINVLNKDGDKITTATIAAYDERSDQGMLFGDFSMFNIISMELSASNIISAFTDKHPLVSCGYPRRGALLCVPFEYKRRDYFDVAGEAFLYPGMSGGPLIDMSTGKVIATNFRAIEQYAVCATLIEIFSNLKIPQE